MDDYPQSFGFDAGDIGREREDSGAGASASAAAATTYVAESDDVALMTVERDQFAAAVLGGATTAALRDFFGDDDDDDGDGDGDGSSSGAHRRRIDARRRRSSVGGGGSNPRRFESAEAAANRDADKRTPQSALVSAGVVDATLHSAMGNHPTHRGIQLASLRVLRRVASPPCGETTRREMGALGALDRVAATARVFGFDAGAGGGGETEEGEKGGGGGGGDDDDDAKVRKEAARAMRALVEGCEQNMRHALSLGCGDMVW
jgi:hypothetical protein